MKSSLAALLCSLLAPGALAAQVSPEVLSKDRPEYNRPVTKFLGERPTQTPGGAPLILQERALPNPFAAADSALAQSAERATASGAVGFTPFVDRTRLYFNTHEGVQWVRGATYKASASPSGFSYTPFLGSAAPRSFPTRLRLASATVDGRDLELFDRAEVSRSGDRIVLDRGPVDVLYDFGLHSVEQSFALDVAGSQSDVTLVLDVDTELTGASEGRGFRFSGALGGMLYGEAIVLDGAGRSAPVASQLSGGQLTLTVPASFLASASGPILVDPIIETFVVDAASGYQRDVDVAYDLSADHFLWVYEDQFSGTDVDIYATQRDTFGAPIGAGYIEVGLDNWRDPNVASVNVADRGLVVATKDDGTTVSVVGRLWDFAAAGPVVGDIQISSATTSTIRFGADVGGSSASSAAAVFVVVWNADFGPDTDIQGRVVRPDGTLGSALFLDSSLDDDSTDVVISESTGDPSVVSAWNVAYINRRLADNIYSPKVVQLNAAGGVIAGPTELFTLPAGDTIGEIDVSDAIQVSSAGPVYAVAFDQFSTIEEDTFISFCRGVAEINTIELQRSEHAELARDQAEARLSTTAEEFVVTYLEGIGPAYTGYVSAFDFTEDRFLSISERRVELAVVGSASSNYTFGGGVTMASRFAGGNYGSRFIGLGYDVGVGDDQDVVGHVYFASNPDSPAFQYCYGNLNSTGDRGFIRLEGSRSATSLKTMVASALPTNAFGYFIVGDGFASVPNPGGSAGVLCVGGTVGRYSNFVTSSGPDGRIAVQFNPQAISQPNGAVVGMSGQFWQFSLWHRDSVSGVATSNFTNAVSILFE